MIKNKIKILDKKIYLRSPIEKDVYGNWWKWFNDPEVTQHMNKGAVENTVEDQQKHFNKINQSKNDLVLAICDRKTNMHIGIAGLHNIDWGKGHAQFGIIIGEKEYWGIGIGTEAWFIILDYGFNTLKLRIIHTKIFAENLSSLRIAEKCGFEEKAIVKNDINKNGIAYDRIHMFITRQKWKGMREGAHS
jgi:[ribosomal protein S5]-alanine N-acetyltransferase